MRRVELRSHTNIYLSNTQVSAAVGLNSFFGAVLNVGTISYNVVQNIFLNYSLLKGFSKCRCLYLSCAKRADKFASVFWTTQAPSMNHFVLFCSRTKFAFNLKLNCIQRLLTSCCFRFSLGTWKKSSICWPSLIYKNWLFLFCSKRSYYVIFLVTFWWRKTFMIEDKKFMNQIVH